MTTNQQKLLVSILIILLVSLFVADRTFQKLSPLQEHPRPDTSSRPLSLNNQLSSMPPTIENALTSICGDDSRIVGVTVPQWSTYEDEKVGVRFQYPSTWKEPYSYSSSVGDHIVLDVSDNEGKHGGAFEGGVVIDLTRRTNVVTIPSFDEEYVRRFSMGLPVERIEFKSLKGLRRAQYSSSNYLKNEEIVLYGSTTKGIIEVRWYTEPFVGQPTSTDLFRCSSILIPLLDTIEFMD